MKIIQGLMLGLLSISLSHAEYYLEYPESKINNITHIKKHVNVKKHTTKKKHIIVQKKKPHHKMTHYYQKSKSRYHISVHTNETYDQRTIDDDVMRDPNMNNQY